MKRILIVSAIVLAFGSVMYFSQPAFAYMPGDKVEVNWKGSWYPAEVMEVSGNRCLIHYDGYDNSWDEWVGPARIRPVGGKRESSVSVDYMSGITVKRRDSVWANISNDNKISVQGRVVGEIASDGMVKRGGRNVGKIGSDGKIMKEGFPVGEISQSGDFYILTKGETTVAFIYNDGSITKSSANWGMASNCCGSEDAARKIAILLVFFSTEFGF
jgi:hypothetical protein